ncbi:tRNA (adenine(22)-N(1))-methyltransferase [Gudongella sp. SC589]|jgi:tRNA (adenine22-N1)-methyltransferase|uniref:tRNA (adenine(22)-N(1))-methyltransferase n=1 Tax=Gudongella sp. SC589 TaxID=3385990 RepID=UPI0039048135
MNLSPRLKKIVDFVPKNSIVADIGTDHGYVPKYLIDEGISKLVIATDISKGSLQKTLDYIREENLDEDIKARLGDGLEPILPFEVDTAIIAGMGGILITEIIAKSMDTAKSINNLILQPMVGSVELRKFLHGTGFRIVDEDIVKEGDKYYEIIVAKSGLQKFAKELDYEISPVLLKKKNPLIKELVETRLRINEKIIVSLRDNPGDKSKTRLMELEKIVRDYRGVL